MIFMSQYIRQKQENEKYILFYFIFSYASEYKNRIKRNPLTHIKLTLQA